MRWTPPAIFVGVLLGAGLYGFAAAGLGVLQALTDGPLDGQGALDDRPLALRAPRARLAATLRRPPRLPAVQLVRAREPRVGRRALGDPDVFTILTSEQAHAGREDERHARFVRALAAKGFERTRLSLDGH